MDYEEKRNKNRETMPGVAELIDAHIAAFGDDFTLIRCIDNSTHHRSTKTGHKPYPFQDEINSPELTKKELP